jgi:predicted metal-binding membrane protein
MSAVAATRSAAARPPIALLAGIAGAWALAIAAEATGNAERLHHDALIEQGPPLWIALPLALAAWQAMTAAMMLPSSLPLVRLYSHASATQPQPRQAMGGFLSGYALVWTGFAALAFLGDVAVHRVIAANPSLRAHEWMIGGAVLALAGAYQFTPLKEACLRECRHPAAFMLRYYERGAAGGFRLGARHGLFCVGCCWALMLVMFAVGIASLVWMAIFTALMVHEKARPLGARTVPLTGIALLGAASIVLMYSAHSARVIG